MNKAIKRLTVEQYVDKIWSELEFLTSEERSRAVSLLGTKIFSEHVDKGEIIVLTEPLSDE